VAAEATTRHELEARETDLAQATEAARAATFAVRAASADVDRARTRLEMTVASHSSETMMIRSPCDGVVLRRFKESEGVVAAGAPLVEIGDIHQLEIVTDVLSTDAVRVTPGARASIEGGSDIALAATVRRIEPVGFTKISALGVQEQRVNIVLDFMETGEDDAPLGDAYRVDTRIVLWQSADVLKVPTSALVRDGARWAVYLAREGRARRTIVVLGRHTAQEAEVRSGLFDGAMVVVHPGDVMHDGVRIVNRASP
jgi:HlyD family secretion protein